MTDMTKTMLMQINGCTKMGYSAAIKFILYNVLF